MPRMNWIAAVGILWMLAGCRDEKVAQAPEPPAQNAVTEYVDRGITTMNKAQDVAAKANEQTRQLNAQAQSAGDVQ